MQDSNLTSKEFDFFMPIIKDIDNNNNFSYIKLGVASGLKDKQDDTLSENFLNSIVKQLKTGLSIDGSTLPIPADDNHKEGLQSIIGAAHDAWIEDNKVMAKFSIADQWIPVIKGLIKAGVKLGGSIKGKATAYNDNGEIDDGFITKIAITDTPAAWDLRGTLAPCPNGICQQISKSLDLNKSWDGSAGRFTDEQYKVSCLYCDPKVGTGDMTIKSGCKLPVKDPDGTLNPAGVKAAYASMMGARNSPNIPESAKSKIMGKLKDYYKELGLTDLGPLKTDKSKNLEVNTMTEEIKDDNMDKTLKETLINVFKSLIPKEEPKIEEPVIEKKVEPELEKAKKGAVCPECGAAIDCDGDNDVSKTVDIEIKKTLEDKDTLIKSLEDKLAEKDTKLIEKEHSELVTKALELTKKVDKKTEIKDEKGLIKHLKSLDVDVETDLDKSIESYSQGLKMALKTIPQGDLPNIVDKTVTKEKKTISDKEFEKTLELMKKIENKGKQEE